MLTRDKARPGAWRQGGRAAGRSGIVHSQSTPAAGPRQCVLRYCGRTIAKLAISRPLGEMVLAMPYRHRRIVEHVSIPPAGVALARRAGCRLWIVRLDAEGRCLSLPLAEVERVGWLRPHRDGHVEWFVPLARFSPTAWQDWDYIERVVALDDAPAPAPAVQQLGLFSRGV